jgi:tetratricopeptide (TPR) repeat protein
LASSATSPTLRGFSAYVSAEIHNAATRADQAEEQYNCAIDLGRVSGATFLVGVASVGLLTVLAEAGRVQDALRSYSEVIDYWDHSGNWAQQRVTLRNLAQLLRRLGDDEPAALLDAAAEQSPNAPAIGAASDATARADVNTQTSGARPPTGSPANVIDVARQAIRENLAES